MNEQIQNILNENGTKTSKIQKLLALGLTRRQVADLVANGNYGFVQNVYKRMMQGLTNTAAQTAATIAPAIDYTFNRNFGIEIEAYNCTRERLARELTAAGINVQVEGYNHTDHTDHWKLVTDSSLSGNNTFELVSPILHGEHGTRGTRKSLLGARPLQRQSKRHLRTTRTHGRSRIRPHNLEEPHTNLQTP